MPVRRRSPTARSPTTTQPPDTARARFVAGDPLRGIASLGVFGIHAAGAAVAINAFGGHSTSPDVFVVLYGWAGWLIYGLNSFVGLFFVLSGYLLSRPYMHSIINDRPAPSTIRYLRNRALRILPPFWIVFAAVLIIYGARGQSPGQLLGLAAFGRTWGASPYNGVFGQAWSLNVEVRYYLLVPLCGMSLMLLRRTGVRPIMRFAVIIVALAIASRASVYHTRHDAPFYESLGSNGHYFLPGIALAAVEAAFAPALAGRRWLRPLAGALSLAGFATLLLSLWIRDQIAFPWEELVGDAGAASLVGGALVLQWSGGGCWRVFDNRALNWVGVRSYPLFLAHSIVLDKLAAPLHIGGYNVTLLILAPAALAVSLVCAAVLHRWVEEPALALKSRRGGGRAAPVARTGGAPADGSTSQEILISGSGTIQ